eukprot:4274320-Ditylum_brightwellii.AAC.1
MGGLMAALPSGPTNENSAYVEDNLSGFNNGQQDVTASNKMHQKTDETKEITIREDKQDEEANKAMSSKKRKTTEAKPMDIMNKEEKNITAEDQ